MKQHVRVYEGLQEHTSLVGFSDDAISAGYDEDIIDFLSDRGYDYRLADNTPEEGVSFRYLEVKPPLNEADITDLGKLCIQGSLSASQNEVSLAA